MMQQRYFASYVATLFLIYVIGDYTTTVSIISSPSLGIKSELNPVVIFLYTYLGEEGLLLLKLSTFAAVGLALYRISRDPKRHGFVKYTLAVLLAYSSVVVAMNFYTLSRILSA